MICQQGLVMCVDQYQLTRQLFDQLRKFLAYATPYLQMCIDGRQCYIEMSRAPVHFNWKSLTKAHSEVKTKPDSAANII